MNGPRRVTRSAAFLLVAMVALVASCSDKGTNPGGGGGGTKELDSGPLPTGRVFVHTFANAGTFLYECTIHNGMFGDVVVAASSTNDSVLVTIDPPGTSNTFSPASASVKPGGRVRWINNGPTHTVTSR